MPRHVDLTDQQFGLWTALERVWLKPRVTHWRCRCACGTVADVQAGHLRSGASTACGCDRQRAKPPGSKPTHGGAAGGKLSPTYRCWRSMRARMVGASALKRRDAKHYAAKGVRLCERWSDFNNFLADMGPRPSLKHTIDRLDSNGHYEPTNCRWATRKEQVASLPQNQKGYRHRSRQGEPREQA